MSFIGNFQTNLQVTDKPVSTIELVACREELLRSKRFKIGILSSGILENPELKSGNLKILLDMMDEKTSEVYITIRKLAMVSLLEVFKDLLPSYSILQISQEGVKRMYTYIRVYIICKIYFKNCIISTLFKNSNKFYIWFQ